MNRIPLSAGLLALLLSTQPGWSLTAEQTWESWQRTAADYGQTISAGSTSRTGNALTLSDLSFVMEQPELSITGTTAEIVLTEQSDGTVVMTGSDESNLIVVNSPKYGEAFEARVRYAHPDLNVVASEVGGTVSFVYSMPTLGLELLETKVDGKPFDLKGSLTANGISGQYASTSGLSPSVTQTYAATSITLVAAANDPTENATFNMNMSLANLAGSSTSLNGSIYSSQDLPALLKSGVSAQGSFQTGALGFDFDVTSPSENVVFKLNSTGLVGAGALDKDKANYNVSYSGLNVDVSGSDIPLPVVQVGLQEFGLNFLMPLSAGDATQPFVLKTTLAGLKLGDPVWNLFDPAAVLPRDPATLVISLAGQAKLLMDLLDEQVMMSATPPAEIHALSISEILLELGGAKLTADGGFTFDNSDMTTFNGIPRPTGSVNVQLVGGNGLLDKLVQMGLVPAEQSGMVRMMSGFFMRPGDGPDTLISELQITPQGQILANGQPMPF